MDERSHVSAISQLDLERYLGKWYEICRLPLKWEDKAATDITARYSLEDDSKIRVDNRCLDATGQPTQSVGQAVPVDHTNSRLEVSFLPEFLRWVPFTKGDYWVLKIDPEYTVALVGTPDRQNLWILARDPSIPRAILQQYQSEALRQGFDLGQLIVPAHTGREVTDAMLEDAH